MIVHVLLGFVTGEETPATVGVVARFFAIHVPNTPILNGNHVRGKATSVPFREWLNLITRNRECLCHSNCLPYGVLCITVSRILGTSRDVGELMANTVWHYHARSG